MSVSSIASLGSIKRKGRSLTVEDCVDIAIKRRKYLKESGAKPDEVDKILGIHRKKSRGSKELPEESTIVKGLENKPLKDLHDRLAHS